MINKTGLVQFTNGRNNDWNMGWKHTDLFGIYPRLQLLLHYEWENTDDEVDDGLLACDPC